MVATPVLLLAIPGLHKVALTTPDGLFSRYFPLGPQDATCKACHRVISDVESFVAARDRSPEKSVAAKHKKDGRSADEVARWEDIEIQMRIREALDESRCKAAMSKYSLGFVEADKYAFFSDGHPGATLLKEHDKWAQSQLTKFCTSIVSAHGNDELKSLVTFATAKNKDAAQLVCVESLRLRVCGKDADLTPDDDDFTPPERRVKPPKRAERAAAQRAKAQWPESPGACAAPDVQPRTWDAIGSAVSEPGRLAPPATHPAAAACPLCVLAVQSRRVTPSPRSRQALRKSRPVPPTPCLGSAAAHRSRR